MTLRSVDAYDRIAIVGLGLIGASLGAALTSRTKAVVRGYDVNPAHMREALQSGWIDTAALSARAAAMRADIIFIACGHEQLPGVLDNLQVSDQLVVALCSVQRMPAKLLAENVKNWTCAHPMAGSELGFPRGVDGELMNGITWAVSSPGETSPALLRLISDLAGVVVKCTPQQHDQAAALVSHVPRILAETMSRQVQSPCAERISSTGWQSLVRTAGSNPLLWDAICRANADNIAGNLQVIASELSRIADRLLSEPDFTL